MLARPLRLLFERERRAGWCPNDRRLTRSGPFSPSWRSTLVVEFRDLRARPRRCHRRAGSANQTRVRACIFAAHFRLSPKNHGANSVYAVEWSAAIALVRDDQGVAACQRDWICGQGIGHQRQRRTHFTTISTTPLGSRPSSWKGSRSHMHHRALSGRCWSTRPMTGPTGLRSRRPHNPGTIRPLPRPVAGLNPIQAAVAQQPLIQSPPWSGSFAGRGCIPIMEVGLAAQPALVSRKAAHRGHTSTCGRRS